MSVPPEVAAAARRWMHWSFEDLALAHHASSNRDLAPRGTCMWAHQAGEKALKSLLVASDIDPPKQHDLRRLANRLPVDSRHVVIGVDLDWLSRWAIDGRYPDDFDEATHAQAVAALDVARQLAAAAEHLDDLLGPAV